MIFRDCMPTSSAIQTPLFCIFEDPPTTFPSPSAMRISSSMKKRRFRSSWTSTGFSCSITDFSSAMEIWKAFTPSHTSDQVWYQIIDDAKPWHQLRVCLWEVQLLPTKNPLIRWVQPSLHTERASGRGLQGAVLHRTTPQQRSRHELSRRKLSMNKTGELFAYSAVPGYKKWAQNGKEVELALHTLHFLLQATTMDLELKDLVRARIFCEDIQLSHVVLKAKHNTATNASVPRMVSNRLVDSFLRCRSDLCVQTVGL